MNEKYLFRAIGDISDHLIVEAAHSASNVRKIKFSKLIALAAVFILLMSLTSWAASMIINEISEHSHSYPDYYHLPSPQTLQEDIGFAPSLLQQFSNGYHFAGGNIINNESYDEDGHVIETYKSFSCTYQYGKDSIGLHIDSPRTTEQWNDVATAEQYQGYDLKYYTYANKLVPYDYILSEQDQADQNAGKYVFSYGSPEVKVTDVQMLVWRCGSLHYSFCAIDSTTQSDTLIQMAKELIDFQNGGNQ